MPQLIRIVYISRSTFVPSGAGQDIEPNVARILAKSRRNNRQRQLVGGLFFGDGCFLQCLEGEAQAIDALYKTISADPRHKDVTTLLRQDIDRLTFSDWSMKYVPIQKPLRRLLESRGLSRFDPYAFTPDLIEAALECLRSEADPTATAAPAEAVVTAAPRGSAVRELAPSVKTLAERSLRWAQAAFVVSLAAFLLAAGMALR